MRRWVVVSLAVVLATAAGCSTRNNQLGMTGTLRMQITDAPAAYDAVRLVIIEVSAHRAGADTTTGWEVLRTDSTTFDLIQLKNGTLAPLVTSTLPAGNYTQIRLKLGAGSTVVVDGVSHPLEIPSGMQSGLKLNGIFSVPAGGTTDLILDFDADRSIVLTGAGTYLLKPVVRVVDASTAGTIKGRVLPDTTRAEVWALVPGDTVGHTSTASDGRFTLIALPSGTYSVAIHPAAGFRDTTITGVSVAANQITDLGDVTLTPKAGAQIRLGGSLLGGRTR